MNSQQLEEIQHADEAIGPDLQLWPASYQHRRDLLAHIAEDGALVRELSGLLEPYSGGAQTLAELVARLKMAQEIRREVVAAMEAQETPPPEPRRVPVRLEVEITKDRNHPLVAWVLEHGGEITETVTADNYPEITIRVAAGLFNEAWNVARQYVPGTTAIVVEPWK